MGKRKKFRKIIAYTTVLLLGGFIILHCLLTFWMENFLEKKLSQRVSEATNGFYSLSYKKLNVSLYNGELTIEGVHLAPDSVVLEQWRKKDSLPDTYASINIDKIEFKGVNLIWRRIYKHLYFRSFEIKNPNIEVFNTNISAKQTDTVHVSKVHKTLYEMISPYIDVLSVQTVNLENAYVAYNYTAQKLPIIYALRNVSFKAKGFLLDKNSSQSGKLLYCDNFEFTTNQPQTLLSSRDINLSADNILLSTSDSIISLKNLALHTQSQGVAKFARGNTCDASVKAVAVNGIKFKRKNGLNYLSANAFDIINPQIDVFKISREQTQKERGKKNQQFLSRSLYDIISPLLQEIFINSITIDKAQMCYNLAIKDSVETFKMEQLNFVAKNFKIDSVSNKPNKILHSDYFLLAADNISGHMTSRNHHINIKHLALNAATGRFFVEGFNIAPINASSHKDFVESNVQLLNISGLQYNNGIRIDSFLLLSPKVHYTLAVANKSSSNKLQKNTPQSHDDVLAMINVFIKYLSIKQVDIKDAEVSVNYGDTINQAKNYTLNNVNLYATDILINQQAKNQNKLQFKYDDIGFSFSNFENSLPGAKYSLAIKQADYSLKQGKLIMSGIRLFSNELREHTDKYVINATLPKLEISGITRKLVLPFEKFTFESLKIDEPQVQIIASNGNSFLVNLNNIELTNFDWNNIQHTFAFNLLNFNKPQLQTNAANGNSFAANLNNIDLINLAWNKSVFSLDSVALKDLKLNIHTLSKTDTTKKKTTIPMPGKNISSIIPDALYDNLLSVAPKFDLGKFCVENVTTQISTTNDSITKNFNIDTTNFLVDKLLIDNEQHSIKWNDVRLSTQNISVPISKLYSIEAKKVLLANNDLHINQFHFAPAYSKMEFSYRDPKHSSWYDVTVDSVWFKHIDYLALFANKTLRIAAVDAKNIMFHNFKNQKIFRPKRVRPMIYDALQRAKLKIDVAKVDVKNFNVLYEELATKGTVPGKFYISNLCGKVDGFTNITTKNQPYITITGNGKFMGKGAFDAVWLIPVDSLNDHFHLEGKVHDFDLTAFNEFVSPMAPMEIKSGRLQLLTFSTDASSKQATAEMFFQYDSLKTVIFKRNSDELAENRFLSNLVNRILKSENETRKSKVSVQRNFYKPTFGYILQIMQPAIIESVGISQKKQEKAMRAANFLKKIKNFFSKKKNKKEQK